MKQYPGESDTVKEILRAYRSAIKYQDVFDQLKTIYDITYRIGQNPKGDWITAAEEIADQLKSINAELNKNINGYNPHLLNTAIANANSISNLDYMSDDPSKLFNGLAMSIWLALKEYSYFNAPKLKF